MSGKGSRPRRVDPKKFSNNWDRIFNKHNDCGTEDCCMQCDTADLGKEWYLTAINPWFKFYWNPVTDEHKQIKYK